MNPKLEVSTNWVCLQIPSFIKIHFLISGLCCLQVLLLLDVDFMVSSSLNEAQHSRWVHSVVSQGVLVVVPALEPVSDDEASQQAVFRTCQGTP